MDNATQRSKSTLDALQKLNKKKHENLIGNKKKYWIAALYHSSCIAVNAAQSSHRWIEDWCQEKCCSKRYREVYGLQLNVNDKHFCLLTLPLLVCFYEIYTTCCWSICVINQMSTNS